MASGATDVLAGARVVATLGEALDGITFACATAMTPRDFGPPNHAPRALFADARAGARIASRSSSAPSATAWPTRTSTAATPASRSRPIRRYGSLNLAQAVQLRGLRMAAGARRLRRAGRARRTRVAPTASRCTACVAHWQETLEATRLPRSGGAEEADGAPASARQPRRARATKRSTSCAASRERSASVLAKLRPLPSRACDPCSSAFAKTSPASASAIRRRARAGRC